MPPIQAPTIRLRQLGLELRRRREAAGLKIEDAAYHLECSIAKVSRIELAKAKPRVRDVRDLCELYGVDGNDRDLLVRLAKDAQAPGWWDEYQDVLSAQFGSFMGMEHEANSVRCYEALLVPGIFQTRSYAEAVLRGTLLPPQNTETEIERRLEVRLHRQRLLEREPRPRVWAILDEAVLRRPAGGRAVHRGQLERLLAECERDGVDLQVLPFERGVHAALDGPFYLFGFPAPAHPDVVYVESQSGNSYLEKSGNVARHAQMFSLLAAQALDPDRSRRFIEERIEECQ
ncbi:helix-turn-helix transcriptional regulator [Nocardiopsis sp. RSe5-2]|uniref:Helix-turn-helix transcriptional regulator n=1 Tax=Nocardiopsis endophytica TaxID=3018445 RepID=A0ABT4U1P1_9ACTN|nr:helix-turn-helix transcriptional regulator [Nocardiopsis endophytica]MDA2810868.1 helix-turn-helix transcriptional regulator [Nocardiopsis endophytica]